MIPIDSSTRLDATQKVLATQAMLNIAHVDAAGLQDEVALIRAFFEDVSQGESRIPFADLLQNARTELSLNPAMFPDPAQKDLVVGSCALVAYADGVLSKAEREAVMAVARQIGMPAERFEQLVDIIRDHLLSQLLRLPDAQSVARVSQEL